MESKRHQGVTLIEMMTILVIIGVILSVAFLTMQGYLPKQRLNTTATQLETLIQQAQTEANGRSFWTCIKFSGNPLEAQIYVDKDNVHLTAPNNCQVGNNFALAGKIVFKSAITIPSGPNCSENIFADGTTSCAIWFDTTGTPKICNGQTNCGTSANAVASSLPAGMCIDHTYQIILSNSDLNPQAKAKEVEVTSGAVVKIAKPDSKGLDSSAWANSSANPGGCE